MGSRRKAGREGRDLGPHVGKKRFSSAGNRRTPEEKTAGVGHCQGGGLKKVDQQAQSPQQRGFRWRGDGSPRSEFGAQKILFLFFPNSTRTEDRLFGEWEGRGERGGPVTAHKPSELNMIPVCG